MRPCRAALDLLVSAIYGLRCHRDGGNWSVSTLPRHRAGQFFGSIPPGEKPQTGPQRRLSRPGLRFSCRRSTNPATANARLSLPRRFDLAFFRANGAARAPTGAPFGSQGSQGRCLHQHGRHILNALPGSSTRPRGGIANRERLAPLLPASGLFFSAVVRFRLALVRPSALCCRRGRLNHATTVTTA